MSIRSLSVMENVLAAIVNIEMLFGAIHRTS